MDREVVFEGPHGDIVTSSDETFEVVDSEGSFVSFRVDDVYNETLDRELRGVMIDAAFTDGPVASILVSAETFEKMCAWYVSRKKTPVVDKHGL